MINKLNCVMLIDDNEDDNFFHKIVLKEAGVTDNIKVAESGIEALEFLTNGGDIPELMFLDINMPKMNGWEFLNEYRKLRVDQRAQVIIIMLTTSLNPADSEKAHQIPEINGFETKPLTKEKLSNILERYFSGREIKVLE